MACIQGLALIANPRTSTHKPDPILNILSGFLTRKSEPHEDFFEKDAYYPSVCPRNIRPNLPQEMRQLLLNSKAMAYKIHITRPIPTVAVEKLKAAGCEVTCPESHGLPDRTELLNSVAEVDGILSILTEQIDSEVLKSSPHLKVVSNMAVGYDNIDVEEASRRDVVVCNTPGVLTETTADFAWALLMAVSRRVVECDQFVRDKKFEWWGPQLMMGTDVFGKTLGIIGFGKIGQAVARRAQGFGMSVLYSGHTAPSESELGSKVSFEELLKTSDFVSLHVPYRESTHHLLTSREFQMMKKSAFLINTARGPVVAEEELVTALNSGEIAGAALDVFEEEPEVHEALLKMQNVVLAPHAASASVETREKMALMAVDNLLAVLEGEEPSSRVN